MAHAISNENYEVFEMHFVGLWNPLSRLSLKISWVPREKFPESSRAEDCSLPSFLVWEVLDDWLIESAAAAAMPLQDQLQWDSSAAAAGGGCVAETMELVVSWSTDETCSAAALRDAVGSAAAGPSAPPPSFFDPHNCAIHANMEAIRLLAAVPCRSSPTSNISSPLNTQPSRWKCLREDLL